MRWLKLSIVLLLTFFLIWLGNTHNPFGSSLPALGNFLSPFEGFWQNAEQSALPTQSDFSFPDLSQEIRVAFDERLVPHIFAENDEDAFFVQGFLTAKYRLWQMDISTRATGGYLAEIMGPRLKKRDIFQRSKGIRWAAENMVQNWTHTGEIKWIEAYTNGINAYLETLSPEEYPVEFKLLGYEPEPWTPLKSALFLYGMVEELSSRNLDLRASNTLNAFGPEMFEFLYPEHNPKQKPVIPDEKAWDFDPVWDDTITENSLSSFVPSRQFHENPSEFVGSNNWAVSGEKTTTGLPILCSDPHLGLTLPSIWFEIQMSTPEWNAYGVSLPGMPGIPIGFNENVAWGETNLGHDFIDWYTIKWVDDDKMSYWVGEDKLEVRLEEEIINIKGQDSHTEQVKYTIWGPVVYSDESSPFYDMAMQWIGHYTFNDGNRSQISTFVGLMKARNFEDYQQAMRCYDMPPQNFAFASNEGDIAITVNGKLPIKSDQQGRFIQDGSDPNNTWKGFVPMDQVPQIKNPESGFIASANQRSTTPDYPYYYNGGFDDYRGRMINRLLGRAQAVTPDSMKMMQNNTYSIKAEEALPLMLAEIETVDSELAKKIKSDLEAWNYHFDKDLKAPAVFSKWFSWIYRITFDEVYVLRDSLDVIYPDSWRLIDLIENQPDNQIFDLQSTEEFETISEVIKMAFDSTLLELADQYEDETYNWQQTKGTYIGHLANIPAFGAYDVPVGGYHDAINAVQDDFGPSWRMVVQLGEEPRAWGVFPGGQSGNPGSLFYDNMILQWARGQYNELFFMSSPEDDDQLIVLEMTFNSAK
jgi:penicillin amidase